MDPAPGKIIGGKYRLKESLARGGMGSVWIASHEELDVDVAVKLIAPELIASDTAMTRFRQEARASAQLRSPNVVQVLDYGVDAGTPYMVMELLEGTDLSELLEKEGRLSLSRALQIVTPLCKALKLAHDMRIVHRDLKPANIFLSRHGDDEIVKILDFGIAKTLQPAGGLVNTSSATLVGSPLYMSPEQSRGDSVDARSDLWSTAVVLFEILTGAPPFNGRGLGDVFSQICRGDTPKPSAHGVEVPGIDDFFYKALAKEPENRFQSARALADAFADVVKGAPLDSLDVVTKRAIARDDETLELLNVKSPSPAPDGDAATSASTAPSSNVSETRDLTILEIRKPIEQGTSKRWIPITLGAVVLGVAAWQIVARTNDSRELTQEPVSSSVGAASHPESRLVPSVGEATPPSEPSLAASLVSPPASAAPEPSATDAANRVAKPRGRPIPPASSQVTAKPAGTGATRPPDDLFAPRPNNR